MPATSRRPLVLVLLLASACHTWRTVPLAPSESASLPPRSRVVRLGGQTVELKAGRIHPDSLIGLRKGERVAIPRDSVAFVQERQFSTARTLGLTVGVLATLFVAMVAAAGAALAGGY